MQVKKLILLIFIGQLVGACLPISTISPSQEWSYADLRSLSKPGDIPPYLDLIAVYTRNAGTDFQIRIDFLDLDANHNFDLYIALDTQSGGTNWLPLSTEADIHWDTLIVFPAQGSPKAFEPPGNSPTSLSDLQPRQDLIPRIVRDPYLDNVVVSLNKTSLFALQPIYHLQVFVTHMGENVILDSLGPISSETYPPTQVPVLLAFWNTFPAFTPAQALRRWDGAHTGPYGERHGLHILLSAVQRNQVPIFLLDLKSPTSLSALDYMGAIPRIKALINDRLLVLPDNLPESIVQLPSEINQSETTTILGKESPLFQNPAPPNYLPDWAQWRAISEGRQISLQFELQASPILFVPNLPTDLPAGYPVVFTNLNEDQPVLWENRILIPLPSLAQEFQPSKDGPSIELRRHLLNIAASEEPGHPSILLLGGNLPQSSWGDPESSEMILRYIANHPWIKPLNLEDLLSMRKFFKVLGSSSQMSSTQIYSQTSLEDSCSSLLKQLNPSCNFPQNAITQAAWQGYLTLFTSLPQNPPMTPSIREDFIGQIQEILLAARWAEGPLPQINCDSDPDQDGQNECILASKNIFGLLELDGARLVFLFALSPDGAHQLIGPSTQFFVDTSNLSLEFNSASPNSPNNLPGGFTDHPHTLDQYTPTVSPDQISFINSDGSITKTFQLTDQGVRVSYHVSSEVTSQIPLVVDPWKRYYPGWANQMVYERIPRGWTWGYLEGPRLEITSSSDLVFSPFTASRTMLNVPENPNVDYPSGHFLPFPMALISVHSLGNFHVQIYLSP